MNLPKGIGAKEVGLLALFSLCALAYGVLSPIFLVEGAEHPILLLASLVLVGFSPITIYGFVLRRRVKIASQPNGEELLKLHILKRQLAASERGSLYSGIAAVLTLLISILFALGLFAYQLYTYLRFGEWQTKSWVDIGWPIPQTSWIGLQDVLNWIANQHAGIIVAVMGFLGAWVFRSTNNSSESGITVKEYEIARQKKIVGEDVEQ